MKEVTARFEKIYHIQIKSEGLIILAHQYCCYKSDHFNFAIDCYLCDQSSLNHPPPIHHPHFNTIIFHIQKIKFLFINFIFEFTNLLTIYQHFHQFEM